MIGVPLWLLLVLVCGVTYRVTRLVTRDQVPITAWPREQLVGFWYPAFAEDNWRAHHPHARPHWGWVGHSLAYLITCDWCVSVYASALVVLAISRWTHWLPHPDWVSAVGLALTASAVTGLVAQREPD